MSGGKIIIEGYSETYLLESRLLVVAQSQSDVSARLTVSDLASTGWGAIRPVNDAASLLRRLDDQRMALEGITKDAREVVEDPVAVCGEGVGVVQLRGAIEQAVLRSGDLERDAAANGITVDDLGVDTAGLDLLTFSHCASHGPEVDGVFTLVLNDGGADDGGGNGKRGEGRKGRKSWEREAHFGY